jgi:hypothetical protein
MSILKKMLRSKANATQPVRSSGIGSLLSPRGGNGNGGEILKNMLRRRTLKAPTGDGTFADMLRQMAYDKKQHKGGAPQGASGAMAKVVTPAVPQGLPQGAAGPRPSSGMAALQAKYGNKPLGELPQLSGNESPELDYINFEDRDKLPDHLRGVLDKRMQGWTPQSFDEIRMPEAPEHVINQTYGEHKKPTAQSLNDFAFKLRQLEDLGAFGPGGAPNDIGDMASGPNAVPYGTNMSNFGYDHGNFLNNLDYARKERDQYSGMLDQELQRLRATPMKLPDFFGQEGSMDFNFHAGGRVKNRHYKSGNGQPKYISDHGHSASGEILIQGDDRIVPDAMHDRYGNPKTGHYNAMRDPSKPWQAGGNPDAPRFGMPNNNQRAAFNRESIGRMGHMGLGSWEHTMGMDPNASKQDLFASGVPSGPMYHRMQQNPFSFSSGVSQVPQLSSMMQAQQMSPMFQTPHMQQGQNPFASYHSQLQQQARQPFSFDHGMQQQGQNPFSSYHSQLQQQGRQFDTMGGPQFNPGFQRNPFAMAFGQQMGQPQQNKPASPMATPNFHSMFANQQPPSNNWAHSNQVTGRPQEPWMRPSMTGGAMGQQMGGGAPLPTPGKSVF